MYNYLARIMPTTGYNVCYCLFFLFGYINSQIYLPLAKISYSVPFYLFSAVTAATIPFFLILMKEADEYPPVPESNESKISEDINDN